MRLRNATMNLLILACAGPISHAFAQYGAGEEWQCGNMETPVDRWVTQHVVPDVFPPNEYMSAYVAPAILGQADLLASQRCAAIGIAHWSSACTSHDRCMELRGTTGISSVTCNDNILSGWYSACNQAYGTPGLGAATNMKDAWTQVFSSSTQSGGSVDITTKLFCQATCHKMANAAYVAMKSNTSSFPALPVPPGTTFDVSSPVAVVFPFHWKVLGRSMSYDAMANGGGFGPALQQKWTGSNLIYEMQYGQKTATTGYTADPDEDFIFSNLPVTGDFLLETEVVRFGNTYYGTPNADQGLIVRNGFGYQAPFIRICTNPGGNQIIVRYRTVNNGPVTDSRFTVSTSLKKKFKLMRIGRNATPFYMDVDSRWVKLAGANIQWDDSIAAGMFVGLKEYTFGTDPRVHMLGAGYFSNPTLKPFDTVTPMLASLLLN